MARAGLFRASLVSQRCVPDAWYVPDSVKISYEISFTRHFCKPQPLRQSEQIRADILAVERETEGLLEKILGRGIL